MSGHEVRWTICICSVPTRKEHLARLMKILIPQVDKYKGQIEILVFWNNFEYSLGYLRQAMMEDAKGEYISHIDDDDYVPDDYCDTIFPLLDGVDYIGFRVRLIDKGKDMPPVYHSLKYSDWSQDDEGYYRGVTHLNPVRTELARQSTFPTEYMVGEDHQWSVGMRGKCKTEYVIDRIMYTYDHLSMGPESVAYKNLPDDTPRRPIFKSKNVRFHPRSTTNA